ncbi:hypothetical protein [Acinetobacter indicus]|jgi:hypothetical protein|uniref:Uncharacterized protein n=1 Tax=Acinetobacter indicus TaxID=756892 RepID=A0AAW8Z6E9_9GAMM|nr:hypothetical protein [Acinetobacter indicus]MCO8087627.1 hypothetical protein [Acinetobacter indicus]MDV4315650.1 hypothetical protein [Acinetobacter indicus]
MIYTYHKRPKPVINQNIKILLQNPKTFGGGHLNVGDELDYEYFFEVKDLNSNLLGFLWFEFNSQNNTIEFNLGKSPSANKFRGFTQSILNDLDDIKNYLPREWFNNSSWLVGIKCINPNRENLEQLLISNGFEENVNQDFLKPIN